MIHFEVRGTPTPQARHRFAGGRVYDPHAKHKRAWAADASRFRPRSAIRGAIEVALVYTMPRPVKHFRTGRFRGTLKDSFKNAPCATKPGTDTPSPPRAPQNDTRRRYQRHALPGSTDVDNLIKFSLDAMNTHWYEDDAQVVRIVASKVYSDELGDPGRTTVYITPLTPTRATPEQTGSADAGSVCAHPVPEAAGPHTGLAQPPPLPRAEQGEGACPIQTHLYQSDDASDATQAARAVASTA